MTFVTPGAILAPKNDITPDHQACVDDVLDAAADWYDGRMPWNVAASVGEIERRTMTGTWHRSPGYTRAVALRHTSTDDPRWRALSDLCTEIVRKTGFVITAFGVFDTDELHQHDDAVRFVRLHDRAPWERGDAA